MPEASVNPAWMMPSISRTKWLLRKGSTRAPVAIGGPPWYSGGSGGGDLGELGDPEHHELGGFHRGDADLGGDDPGVAVLGGVRRLVAPHVKGLLDHVAEQCAVS